MGRQHQVRDYSIDGRHEAARLGTNENLMTYYSYHSLWEASWYWKLLKTQSMYSVAKCVVDVFFFFLPKQFNKTGYHVYFVRTRWFAKHKVTYKTKHTKHTVLNKIKKISKRQEYKHLLIFKESHN